jgi:hypothetical protein
MVKSVTESESANLSDALKFTDVESVTPFASMWTSQVSTAVVGNSSEKFCERCNVLVAGMIWDKKRAAFLY